MIPILEPNVLIYIPYPRVNCLKTIPFTAAHTYIAHIWQYPPRGVRICVLSLNVYVLRRKPCLCWNFAIVVALVFVAFADLPTLTILPWVGPVSLFNFPHGLMITLAISRFFVKNHSEMKWNVTLLNKMEIQWGMLVPKTLSNVLAILLAHM